MGDPKRWPELFESNRGAELEDGRALTNPNLIWPGLRLNMPVPVEQDTAVPPPVAAPPLPSPITDGSTPQAPTAPPEVQTLVQHDGMTAQTGAAAGAASAASAAAVAALLAVRRRGRRALAEPPLGDEPESDVVVRAGFAELRDLARDRSDPVQAAAIEVLRFLDANGVAGRVGVVSARHGRSSTTLALVCQRLADRPMLQKLVPAIAKHLGLSVAAQLSRDHDTLLRLGPLRHARFADPSGASSAPCALLGAGLLPDRRVLYVNWPSLGHVLVTGRAPMAVSSVLSTLLATVSARFDPAELQILTVAANLTEPLQRLPHQVGRVIDPADQVATSAALHDARAELLKRMERVERGGNVNALPELLIVLPDIETLTDHASTLDMLGVYGPAHRVRLLASCAHPELLSDGLLSHFTTRAVLRLPEEAQGARLLGQPGAADLLGGGQLLLRLDAREPLELYAFRASDAELDRFVRALRGEPIAAPGGPAWPVAVDVDDDPDPEPPTTDPAPRHVQHIVDFAQPTKAPILVRCFGAFDVVEGAHDLTGASSPAEAAQRAPAWEVLAYLCSHPEGVVGLVDVLSDVWPDGDPRTARAHLDAAVEQLNMLLQRSVLVEHAPLVTIDDRADEVRLDPDGIDSDVHRFVRLCQAATLMPSEQVRTALARARELYRGDLLDGPGARAYGWAVHSFRDGELSLRDRYREQCLRATLRLARLLMRASDYRSAIPLFQSLLEVEPLLEDVVRDLCRCFAAVGDRNAIVDEDARLRIALRQAYATYGGPSDDPDPEPATSALIADLLQEVEARGAVLA
ncbi:MAG: bacterial transcriptional activator domain-containing protein [Chloroflexi bacterium]|nr:bacterial transcriptional activator domain-containing protein [Chloroflexota bacterium]